MANEDRQETAVDRAHRLLIERIVTGTYPIGTDLPGERTLSKDLGVARNALREALQRLGHNGWLEISQGRATRVRDYLREGNLKILVDLLHIDHTQTRSFVPHLLHMWSLLAHDYTAQAVRNEPERLAERLELYASLTDNAEAATRAMWQLHRTLIDYCGNVAYGLIFNSFADFYMRLAQQYYQLPENRERARAMWGELYNAVTEKDTDRATELVHAYIRSSMNYW
ncbi:MAG: GntR family transcriptional regulator, partial [Chloroflexota bacterium]